MSARPIPRPAARAQAVTAQVNDIDGANRAVEILTDQMNRQAMESRAVLVLDLVIGENRVNHGLGRVAQGANVCPSVADATFAWSHRADGPRQSVITVVGVSQPSCTVEFY